MKSYRQRISDFWKWFEENEAKLADYVDNVKGYDPDEVVAFFSEGLNIAIDGCSFNIGGEREVNLTPEGSAVRTFLTTYLVNSMPEKLKKSWNFVPWKKPSPGSALRIHNVDISADDILVSVEEENGKFGLEFYNATLNELDEDQAYQICYIMIDLSLGENIAMAFINWVDKSDEQKDGMIRLSELRQYMNDHIENGIDDNYNPIDSYSSYSGEPSEDDDTPRYDIIVGFSNLLPLLRDYYDNENNTYTLLEENGLKAAFLTIARTNDDHNIDLEIRNKIVDRMETEILGEAGSGSETGVVTGQAIGENNTYIDLLLYDEDAFKSAVPSLLKDYDLDVKYYDFTVDAEPHEL